MVLLEIIDAFMFNNIQQKIIGNTGIAGDFPDKLENT